MQSIVFLFKFLLKFYNIFLIITNFSNVPQAGEVLGYILPSHRVAASAVFMPVFCLWFQIKAMWLT